MNNAKFHNHISIQLGIDREMSVSKPSLKHTSFEQDMKCNILSMDMEIENF